jgi:hypothetical protein
MSHLHAKGWLKHGNHMLWFVFFIRKERNDLPVWVEPPEGGSMKGRPGKTSQQVRTDSDDR